MNFGMSSWFVVRTSYQRIRAMNIVSTGSGRHFERTHGEGIHRGEKSSQKTYRLREEAFQENLNKKTLPKHGQINN